jgi:hypothetical protein
MIQRGKRSTAALSLVPLAPRQRATPPKDLSAAEKTLFRAVISTKPAEWFTADAAPLLAEYCRHAVMADRLARQIADAMRAVEKTEGDDRENLVVLDRLLAMRDRESKAVVAFARSLRLTMQARYRGEVAARAHDRVNSGGGPGNRPWQA